MPCGLQVWFTSRMRTRGGTLACRAAALVAATALAGCGVASAGHPDGARSSTIRPVTVVTAGAQSRDVFLTGAVTRDGHPASGASVAVAVMADDRDLPVGATIPTWESEPVTTKADGAFVLRVNAAEVPAQFLSAGSEYLNFDIRAVSGNEAATWSWTLSPLQPGAVWRTDGAGVDDKVADMRLNFGRTPTIELTDSLGARETHDLDVFKFKP